MAKDEIVDVINRWSRAISRQNWDLLRSCYHPDGVDHHGAVDAGVDAFIEWLQGYHRHISQAIFFNTNSLLEFAGPEKAFVETNVLGLQRYTTAAQEARAQFLGEAAAEREVELTVQFCGRYLDTFTHRDGQWRIEVRRTVYETVDGAEARGPLPTDADGLVAARPDAHDPLWSARGEAGIGSHSAGKATRRVGGEPVKTLEIAGELAVRNLVARAARLTDSWSTHEEYLENYPEDCTWSIFGTTCEGHAGMASRLDEMFAAGVCGEGLPVRHCVTSLEVSATDYDALARSVCVMTSVREPAPGDPATGPSGVVPIVLGYGNYNDECVRTDTGWRIKNRICDTVFW